jgi:RimJ/RimL family protein N-acetyltransferase
MSPTSNFPLPEKKEIVLYETDRLYVRPFTKEDIEGNYKNWFHDQEVTAHNSHGLFPCTESQMNSFLKKLKSLDDLVWAVFVNAREMKSEGVPIPPTPILKKNHIGNITLQNINWVNRSAEFACVFGEKEHWGKGYCTEAAKLLFNHGFSKLNLHRIWTGTAATNIGMQKVAAKLGMKKEGVFRHGTFLNGKYVDILAYGIINE